MAEDPLIRFLKRRTRSRFTALVRATRAEVLNAAYRVLGDLDRAEDVTQDVFLKLLTVKWDPSGIRSPRGLLISTALLAARATAREEARRAERERRAGGARPARDAGPGREEAAEVRDAVAGLPAGLCECVELRYFGGLSIADVAGAMGWPLRTTNHRLKEARDLLRARLAAPAAAAVLPILDGETEAAWPAVGVSADFARRLEDLCRAGPGMARIAGRKPGLAPAVLLPAAGILLLLLGGAWLGGSRNGAPEAPPVTDRAAVVAPGAHGTGAVPATFPLAARGSGGADPPFKSPGREPAAGGGKPAVDGLPAGSGGFSIEVVDDEGALVKEGDIHLRIEPFDMPLGQIESLIPLAPFAGGFEKHSLARGNPHELRGIPPCALSAQATAPGRAPSGREALRIDAGRVTALRLLVPRPRHMEVRVLDGATGEPLSGARVVSVSETARRGLPVEKALLALETERPDGADVTGADGTCVLEGLGAGLHRLEAYHAGYRTARLEGADPASGALLELESLATAGSISVSARGTNGEPVGRVSVSLEIEGESASRRQALDAAGRARFEGVPAGRHTVGLDMAEWASVVQAARREGKNHAQARDVVLGEGEEASVELGFLRGTSQVDVLVVDGAGKPRAGVAVTLSGPCLREARTGPGGRAVFEEVPAGEWSARAGELSGWVLESWGLRDLEARSVRIVLGEGAIRGRVSRGPNAAGVPGLLVNASGPAWSMTRTGPDGSFAFKGAAPGSYTIQAIVKEGEARAAEVEVPVGGDAPPVEIRLDP